MTGSTVYRPLDATHKSIRLLRIRPSENERIHCDLEVVALEDLKHNYVALSYAWGTAEHDNAILVNGHEFDVSSNLFDFLSSLVATGDHRLFYWIDQICINQNDVCEKESQVAMMHLVYSSASETIIWLGIDPHSGLAISCLQKMLPVMTKYPTENMDQYWLSEVSTNERKSIAHLARLPYWTRHWILQELCLSQKRTARYGTLEIPWAVLSDCLDQLHLNFPRNIDTGLEHKVTSHLIKLSALISQYSEGKLRSFTQLWLVTTCVASETLCQDIRDKVYGIQNLFPTESQIPVNYQLSTREVFLRTVQRAFAARDDNRSVYFLEGIAALAIGMNLVSCSIEHHHVISLACRLHERLEEAIVERVGRHEEIHIWKLLEHILKTYLLKP